MTHAAQNQIQGAACPGVNVDEWQKNNRVPVFKNRFNRWLVVRTTRDSPSSDKVRADLYDAMVRWSGEWVDVWLYSSGGVSVGHFDMVKIVRAEKGAMPPFRLNKRLKRAQDLPCGPMPTINAGGKPLVWFEVEFVWRGYESTIPWPVARTLLAGTVPSPADACPIGADMMLYEVGVAGNEAPAEKSLIDKLAETSAQMSAGMGKIAFWPIMGIATAFGVVGLARKRARM